MLSCPIKKKAIPSTDIISAKVDIYLSVNAITREKKLFALFDRGISYALKLGQLSAVVEWSIITVQLLLAECIIREPVRPSTKFVHLQNSKKYILLPVL